MSYLSLIVRKDTSFAESILPRWELMFYRTKLNSIYVLVKNRLGKYIVKEGKGYFVTREEDTPEVIEHELQKLERFLFGDENTLAKEEHWKVTNDRIIRKVYHRAKMFKTKAIQAALKGHTVMNFLNCVGIVIEYRKSDVIIDDKKKVVETGCKTV